MKEYYLSIKTKDIDTINNIMSDLSIYDCDMHLDKIENKNFANYTYKQREVAGHKIGEKVGKTLSEYKNDLNFYNCVGAILDSFGINKEHKGYRYSVECVRLMNTYGSGNFTMKKDIYPTVSQWYNTIPSTIEHNIRNAIDSSWKENSELPSFRQNEMKTFAKKPSNMKFLSHICRLTFMIYIDAY